MNKLQKFLIIYSFFVGIIIIIIYYPRAINYRDFSNYSILLLAYLIILPLFIYRILRDDYNIFEPFTLVSALYIVIMIFQPMIDIVNGDYYIYGKDVMNGCMTGTIVFIFSYIAFYIGYSINNRKTIENPKPLNKLIFNFQEMKYVYKYKVKIICYGLWVLGFIFALLFFYYSGRDLINALSLGLLNPVVSQGPEDSPVKFLMKLSFFMIIPWIYIIHFDKNKIVKILTTVFMAMNFSAIGSRYIIVVCVVAVLIVPYLVSKKPIPIAKLFIVFSFLLVISGMIAYFRGTTRQGGTINLTGFSETAVTDVFETNFTIYKAYYAVIDSVPSKVPYQLGKGLIVYSLVSFIPSIIFPFKRNFDNVAFIIGTAVNPRAALSGLAYINLGQFYAEFGAVGCIVCMFIFGWICKTLKGLYSKRDAPISSIILYSVLLPFLMQIVTRGDLAQQVGGLLGLVPPFLIIRYFSPKIIAKSNVKAIIGY
jgi:oligosaccharide repeat unit polymerase